jgi:hypothetical protein
VRASYREALEDGLSDEQATEKVLAEFAADLADVDAAPVVWLALAVGQHERGRLTAEVRDRALEVIDGGADLRRWEYAESRIRARRAAVLTKTRDRLVRPQPARRPVRRPARHVTALEPGDVLAYKAPSGRFHLLTVRAVSKNRYGAFPLVRLLDFHQEHLPPARQMSQLPGQPAGRGATPGRPAGPWWCVDGLVHHRRGHDFADYGFELVGHVPAAPEIEQDRLRGAVRSSSGWPFWQSYLNRQDQLLGERLAGPN